MMYKQYGKVPHSESTRFTRAEAVAGVRDGILVIPEGKTSLDFDFAFFVVRDDLPKVHTLVIPSSVTRIASMRGDHSSGPYGYPNNPFSAVVVSEDNPNYASREGVLFTKSLDKLICYPCGKPDRSYSVPAEVKTIGAEAFLNVEHLEQIFFQDGTSIEEFAFLVCAQIDFPEMVSVYKKGSDYLLAIRGEYCRFLSFGEKTGYFIYDTSADLFDDPIRRANENDLRAFLSSETHRIDGHQERVHIMHRFAEAIAFGGYDEADNGFSAALSRFGNTFYGNW